MQKSLQWTIPFIKIVLMNYNALQITPIRLSPESQEAIALQGSLGRLRNYFNSSDYEITDFTGKDYDERIPMRMKRDNF
jgi:hypothetical protein